MILDIYDAVIFGMLVRNLISHYKPHTPKKQHKAN